LSDRIDPEIGQDSGGDAVYPGNYRGSLMAQKQATQPHPLRIAHLLRKDLGAGRLLGSGARHGMQ
jgi:hypothetical protein